MQLTKEALLAAATTPDRPREVLHIPELGGDVTLQGMTGKERDQWESSLLRGRGQRQRVDGKNIRARLVVRCLIDESGARMFSDDQADLIGNLPVKILQPMFNVAQKLCGVSDEDVDELGGRSGEVDGSGSPSS